MSSVVSSVPSVQTAIPVLVCGPAKRQHCKPLLRKRDLCSTRLNSGLQQLSTAAQSAQTQVHRSDTPHTASTSAPVTQQKPANALKHTLRRLGKLLELLNAPYHDYEQKVHILLQSSYTKSFLSTRDGASVFSLLQCLPMSQQYALLCLVAMGQQHVLTAQGSSVSPTALRQLATDLLRVDQFYNSLGGVIGYQAKCLQLIFEHQDADSGHHAALASQESQDVAMEDLLVPVGISLHGGAGCTIARDATAKGMQALPYMAEIYPLGGAGDRLGLQCPTTGECLPTAMLPYCGRTLLEGLIRDLQAREYLYYKLTGHQHITPVAIMTSDAKGNHERVLSLLKAANWFGRGEHNFRLFRQPMVPVVSVEDGSWLVSESLQPHMKPGGHGAIWKLMLDEGVFDFFADKGRDAAIVRQISNPMAGLDNMLLALSGIGHFDGKSFGFASCDRVVGAAEGINVLRHRKITRVTNDGNMAWEYEYGVTCVEYTEFERLGVTDAAEQGSKLSRYPANTNVLYLGLQAARAAVEAGVASGGGAALPGMVFNTGKKVSYKDIRTGCEVQCAAGRLECTMQNLADCFTQRFDQQLPKQQHGALDTFVVFNTRRKVTSSAKRQRAPGSLKVAQTPDGSFLDLMRNAADLLAMCNFNVPQMCDVEEYLANGPSFLFLHHPGLGPLWSVIAQKVRNGRMAAGSELVLELADAHVDGLTLDGSLVVRAEYATGAPKGVTAGPLPVEWLPHAAYDAVYAEGPGKARMAAARAAAGEALGSEAHQLQFSNHNGRMRLVNCRVVNRGVDWQHDDNVYWQHKVHRHEAVEVVLEGRSEFEACDVTFRGAHTFRVPSGYRMVCKNAANGGVVPELIPLGPDPTWEWQYKMFEDGSIHAQVQEQSWWNHGQIPMMRLRGEDMGILI